MTALSLPFFRFRPARSASASVPVSRGAPQPQRMPVFVHDAVIPWRDETLLLALLRQQAESRYEDTET